MKSNKHFRKHVTVIPEKEKKINYFFIGIPLIYLLPLLPVGFAFAMFKSPKASDASKHKKQQVAVTPSAESFKIFRQYDFSYAQPLVYYENEIESPKLLNVKRDITYVINKLVNDGIISEGSAYVSHLKSDEWFSVNPQQTFMPASLFKLPMLMVYLKQSEKDPSILDRRIRFDESPVYDTDPTFKTKSLELGKSYTFRELFRYMICSSDNNATFLLNKYLDIVEFENLFVSIGLEKPYLDGHSYRLSVFDYSKFLHILYNSTYLSNVNSSYALSLLAESDFTEGMRSAIPIDIPVAHKFGESGNLERGAIRELHESGIIYFENDPILITVSTKGKDVKLLPGAIKKNYNRNSGKKKSTCSILKVRRGSGYSLKR